MNNRINQMTKWFRVGSEDPSPDKPGLYEVQFS